VKRPGRSIGLPFTNGDLLTAAASVRIWRILEVPSVALDGCLLLQSKRRLPSSGTFILLPIAQTARARTGNRHLFSADEALVLVTALDDWFGGGALFLKLRIEAAIAELDGVSSLQENMQWQRTHPLGRH
jgi:hypothetical protein